MARDNPFRLAGLSWKQRYLYATANHHPLLGIPSLLLATTPFLWFLDPTIKVSGRSHERCREPGVYTYNSHLSPRPCVQPLMSLVLYFYIQYHTLSI